MKTVYDLFSKAIKEDSSIKNLHISEIKFSKKENSAIVNIVIDEKINPLDILDFEDMAKEKYLLKNFELNSKIKEKTKFEINEEDIQNLLKYYENINICQKDIFKDSIVELKELRAIIKLSLPNASFLKLKGTDLKLQGLTKSFFGQEIEYIIEDSEESELRYKEMISKRICKEEECIKEEKVKPAETKKDVTKNLKQSDGEYIVLGKDILKDNICKIIDISEDMNYVVIEGTIENIETRETKNNKLMLTLDVYDKTSTISCKAFLDPKKNIDILKELKESMFIKVLGRTSFDMYSKELCIMINSINKLEKKEQKKDISEEKRIELHAHTQMSAMDGIAKAKDLVKKAADYGHSAVAITDHGVAQNFPEAALAALDAQEAGKNIKVIYGLEGYLLSDVDVEIIEDNIYTIFDIETTGFNPGIDSITEIAAVKVKDGKIIEEFETFVNPERKIPKEVQELTHITDEDVKDAPNVKEAVKDFLKFAKGTTMVAHNARFDMGFIKFFAKINDFEVPKNIIDTLAIAREIFEEYENHKLGTIAKNLEVSLEDAHRAINDVKATYQIFIKMTEILNKKNIDLNKYIQHAFFEDLKEESTTHVILLAKNLVGLKNLYKLISFSHIRYFHKKPRIPRSVLNRYREGIILGSACERGEVFQLILENKIEEATRVSKYYDYLEVQPIDNNIFYVRNEVLKDRKDLEEINKNIIQIGEKLSKLVVATGDVHFLEPEDEVYRRIIMAGQGYEDADNQAPLYYRTTEEMLEEFSYIDKAQAKKIVIENTKKIADMIETITPLVKGVFNPVIAGSDEEIKKMTYEKAKAIYGENLPEIVEKRIDKELNSIITHGFSVMYLIAQKLVKKSNEDGYLVGSRGSVGSSFVATMTGITEVNPLPPHYICTKCKHSIFPKTEVTTGTDLEDKNCPKCNEKMKKDGMDIPFETFLGFKGDKIPDIDLNFSGEYQSKAHTYTETLFGKSKTFRAGTISTLADRTAYGFVKKYFESKKINVSNAEISRLVKKCTGIKRTTGQHPGGIIVVPQDKEIYDFCPVQKPADDMRTKTLTTHFDFHSIHDNLLKLDILGHDDPTVIKMLEDLTSFSAKKIPLDEPKVMSIFRSTEALGISEEQVSSKVGTFAVPEFGTKFVRQMLIDTNPKTFGDLVKISGLSHGTDVWLKNAQDLIKEGKATLNSAICTRDDIMIYLIHKGLDPSDAFKIMEIVRKGKAEKLLDETLQNKMKENNVPNWYIESCKKIKYMFPKAHAVAYVMMAYRIAYYKVYFKEAFYATYLSVRASAFNSELMCVSKQKVKENIKNYEQITNPTQTEKDLLTVLEVVNEMLERDVQFLPIDIYKSDDVKFLVEDGKIRPPISAIPSFGIINAQNILKARELGKFSSKDHLAQVAKLGKIGIELLEKCGCLKDMPKSSQVSLFEM